MIHTVVFIGKFASGKTEGRNIFHTLYPGSEDVSDRILLAQAVRRDVAGQLPNQKGMWIGARSIAFNALDVPDDDLMMRVIDPSILNEVHEGMLHAILKPPDKSNLRIVEFAIGPDVPLNGGILRQDAKHIFQFFQENLSQNEILVVEVDAPLDIRLERNKKRGSTVEDEAFRMYSPDGGEGNPAMAFAYGIPYVRINNTRDDLYWFEREVFSIAQINVGLEGNSLRNHELV
ncbi:hypothetical protein HY947_00680 [Candidatus Gottesmanbacteria bacterium]|nr:hypothetical protein [Candidatus Gottesmanbacteria bacterium]